MRESKVKPYHLHSKHYDKRILHFPFFDDIKELVSLFKSGIKKNKEIMKALNKKLKIMTNEQKEGLLEKIIIK